MSNYSQLLQNVRSRQYFERLWCQQCGIQTNQTWLLKWGTINVLSTLWIDPLNIIIVHSYAVFSHINFGFIIFSHSTRKHLDVFIIILGKKVTFWYFTCPCWTSLCSRSTSYIPRNEGHLSKSQNQNSLPSELWCYVPTSAVNLVANILAIFSDFTLVW